MVMQALLVPANTGEPVQLVDVARDYPGHLDDLQRLVGGHIETIGWGRRDAAVYFNDEGKLHGLPYNARATILLADHLMPGDWIAGPLVIVGFDPESGDDVDLPDDLRAAVPSW